MNSFPVNSGYHSSANTPVSTSVTTTSSSAIISPSIHHPLSSINTGSFMPLPLPLPNSTWPSAPLFSQPVQQHYQENFHSHTHNHVHTHTQARAHSHQLEQLLYPRPGNPTEPKQDQFIDSVPPSNSSNNFSASVHNLLPPQFSSFESVESKTRFPQSSLHHDIANAEQRGLLELPQIPFSTTTRKRHKVATSCNRCRQNKRKCDSAVPCANCKKNNVDCCYTDAQLSRAIWGDLPLSQDKVIGVTANRPKAPGVNKSTVLPYSTIGHYMYKPNLLPLSQNRRSQQVLTSQSRNLSKNLRIAHLGPQYPEYPAQSSHSGSMALDETQQFGTISGYNTQNNHKQTTGDKQNQKFSKETWQNDQSASSISETLRLQQQYTDNRITPHEIYRTSDNYSSSSSTPPNNQPVAIPGRVMASLPLNPLPLSDNSYTQSSSLMSFHLESPRSSASESNRYHNQTQGEYEDVYANQPSEPVELIYQQQPLAQKYRSSQLNNDDSSGFDSSSQQHITSMVPPLNIDPSHSNIPRTSSPSQPRLPPQIIGETQSQDITDGMNAPFSPSTSDTPSNNDKIQHIYHAKETIYIASQANPLGLENSSLKAAEKAQTKRKFNESQNMQRIAKDMLAIKKYDLCLMIPRHISQENDEFFIPQHQPLASSFEGVPTHLLLLPRDANYLVDVFFENAYFYYPIINRSIVEIHLMGPHTPQSSFLLNIIFMTACKHLARNSDLKRAIQFRERAREILLYIDDKSRLSRIQGLLLGSMVVYGVFTAVINYGALCGAHSSTEGIFSVTSEGREDSEHSNSTQDDPARVENGSMPEAAYQARLWTFWGFYVRESMARLYFGWPYGIDSMAITSDLPKIQGHVGIGGRRVDKGFQSRIDEYGEVPSVIGKRRDSNSRMDREKKFEKRHMAQSMQDSTVKASDRVAYRNPGHSSQDDSDVSDERNDSPNKRVRRYQGSHYLGEGDDEDSDAAADQDRDTRMSIPISSLRDKQGKRCVTAPFLTLSDKILKQQSNGSFHQTDSQLQAQDDKSQNSHPDQFQTDFHMKRMRLLIDAEEDSTDGGSFARILFLEEIRLWTLGRRVALYIAGRSSLTAPSACPKPFVENQHQQSESELETDPWSEEAWLQDHVLQSLQADLIAWEQALPESLKFRQDVDSEQLNHKVNGKMGILVMSYYTITILLQSSFLPIAQYISSRTTTPNPKGDGTADRSMPHTEIPPSLDQNPSSFKYFNTAHKICTGLSNVVLHHVEIMLDTYPNWCSIQAKVNHAIIAALRVSCLNAKLSQNTGAAREEAKAVFRMGSDLYHRLALLPYPLTIRDWPMEEDVQQMKEIEEEFREMMMEDNPRQREEDLSLEPTPATEDEDTSKSTSTKFGEREHIFGQGGDYGFEFDQGRQ